MKTSENSANGHSASPAQSFDATVETPQNRLKHELDLLRNHGKRKAETKPMAAERKKKDAGFKAAQTAEPGALPRTESADEEADRDLAKLLIMSFTGTEPSQSGPRAIRELLHNGLIAGVVFGSDNIQSKSQLKDLIKFFAAETQPKPFLAISETGGLGSPFPRIKDFEPWPSQRNVASKDDPDYAYLTYRSLGSFLGAIGFNLNFGPMLTSDPASRDPSASFADGPLQAGVFAKTFILGHADDHIVAVPMVDGSDFAVRAMKSLLLSHPSLPIALDKTTDDKTSAAFDGLIRGPRFCKVAAPQEGSDLAEVAKPFTLGCDALVIEIGKTSPAELRDAVARGVLSSLKNGALSLDALHASAEKLSALRSSYEPHSTGFSTQSR